MLNYEWYCLVFEATDNTDPGFLCVLFIKPFDRFFIIRTFLTYNSAFFIGHVNCLTFQTLKMHYG